MGRGEATCCVCVGIINRKEIPCGEPAAVLVDFDMGEEAKLWMCARHYTKSRDRDDPTIEELRADAQRASP